MQDRSSTSNTFAFLAGAAVGATLMALADPGRGARRRAYAREKMLRGMRLMAREGWKLLRNTANNTAGAVAETKAHLREGSIPDQQLEERVKAQLGHSVRHWDLEVRARGGHVIVEGPVLTGETSKLAERLEKTRGVRSYDLRVQEHASEAELQAAPRSVRERQEAM